MSEPSAPDSVPSPSPSDISPKSLPEAKKSYFSPLSSPRLNSIQELSENLRQSDDTVRPRESSISSITFQLEDLTDSLKPRGQPKHGKDRIRAASPPAPR